MQHARSLLSGGRGAVRTGLSAFAILAFFGAAHAQRPADTPSSPAAADAQQLVELNSTAKLIYQAIVDSQPTRTRPDRTVFCYLDGKSYSEGAVVEGRECRPVKTAQAPGSAEQALVWQPIE